MKKHAYLIMAHNNCEILKKLLELLDDRNNDIYIHIDKKVNCFNINELESVVKESKVFFTDRISVSWGDISQIKCEYLLLKKALEKKHEYYHFLSGVDLPLHSQEYIHEFFDKNKGKEVVQLTTKRIIDERNAYYRISRYHFFQKYGKEKNKLKRYFYDIFQKICMPIQSLLKVDRIKKDNISIGYGANWVSITHDFAKYVLSKEDWVLKRFKYSICADEVFIQTLLVNSEFKNNVYQKETDTFNGDACMRYIDWDRGNPYVFKKEDFNSLKNSNMLFARKFDMNTDKEIIDSVYKMVKERKKDGK